MEHLIKNTEEAERARVTIVVFARDTDKRAREEVRAVVANFSQPLAAGMLQLIQAPQSIYQGLASTQVNVQAVENLYSAFLVAYCSNMSQYYLQLSDSIRAVPGYVSAIHAFIKSQGPRYWVTLDFVPDAPVGKLIRAGGRDETQLRYLLIDLCSTLPADQVYGYFRRLNAQKKPLIHEKPLFEPLPNL